MANKSHIRELKKLDISGVTALELLQSAYKVELKSGKENFK